MRCIRIYVRRERDASWGNFERSKDLNFGGKKKSTYHVVGCPPLTKASRKTFESTEGVKEAIVPELICTAHF